MHGAVLRWAVHKGPKRSGANALSAVGRRMRVRNPVEHRLRDGAGGEPRRDARHQQNGEVERDLGRAGDRDGVAIETIDLDAVKNPYTLRLEDERGVNMVAVEPGRIRVAEADCPDEVCVHTGWIDGPATPIACVPHGLTVTVAREGGDGDGLDAVAR